MDILGVYIEDKKAHVVTEFKEVFVAAIVMSYHRGFTRLRRVQALKIQTKLVQFHLCANIVVPSYLIPN